MKDSEIISQDFNRRDFLKGGSVATIMTMLGGVELLAQTTEPVKTAYSGAKTKVAVIGLGAWGRELLTSLTKIPQADIAAICDTYPASLRRCASTAPGAAQTPDYKTILENKDIKAVVIATPTHKHKDIVIEALKAGKHVYCEAPLANTIEDAKAIASAAHAAPKTQLFQAGLQTRSDPERPFLLPFIRSGCLGTTVMARAQWHKFQTWRSQSPNPEREKELNWRLDKSISLGLVGEIGCHPLDQACWFLNGQPVAVTGFGSLLVHRDDGREVPDTIQVVLEFPGGVNMIYDATLANSFDSEYEMFYGNNAAVMLRDSKAWMFKEVNSPLLGWEVYARKETFYKDTGIALLADASKAVVNDSPEAKKALERTPLDHALENFVLTAADIAGNTQDYVDLNGADDVKGLLEYLSKNVPKRHMCSYLDAYRATVVAIKANEAVMSHQRVLIQPELFALNS
ncbi:MAG TPA: Gfo/Idh/MocA family oxidoreductase [Candidatus Binatia bacterium]|jgi:predicted dehydrogenase|nr:Gfo/Idh/MocA family oxidoreductase [Candidatus Binatia bacterium]